jgi:hypothetical protein
MGEVTTSTHGCVINQDARGIGIVAGDAHRIARISYRQLDHWARQGWVRPSIDPGKGRSGKRLYAIGDVVRLDLLRHLAISKVNTAVAGPLVAELEVPDGDLRVLWGPLGSRDVDRPGLSLVSGDEALAHLEKGGGWVVYNPAGVRTRISVVANAGGNRTDQGRQVGDAVSPERRQSA